MARRVIPAVMALLLLTAGAAFAGDKGGVTIEPAKVEVGLFYSGEEIVVKADAPAGEDVVVKVSGMKEDLELKKKGKRGGILWMNVGEISYHEVPSLFYIRSTRPLSDIASEQVLGRLGIGYEALKAKMAKEADGDAMSLFGELIKLKEREKLFSVDEKGVETSDNGSGSERAVADFFLPPKAPRGEYKIEVYGFKGGQGTLLGSGTIEIGFSPTAAFIFKAAHEHGLLYGIFASVVAIIAGIVTGFIFGGKGEAH